MASLPQIRKTKRRTQLFAPDRAIAIDVYRRQLVDIKIGNPERGATSWWAKTDDGRIGTLRDTVAPHEFFFYDHRPEPPLEYEIMQTGAVMISGHKAAHLDMEQKRFKTGTDVSLAECRASGYPVVEHGKRPLDPAKLYLATISNPPAWNAAGTQVKPNREKDGRGVSIPVWALSTWISYKDLWEQFERGGEAIKSYCDFKNCPFPHWQDGHWSAKGEQANLPRPTFLDFASLAGTVHSYQGIE